MKITPLDIDQQEFSTVFRGFDAGEVRSFLNQVSRQLEELVRTTSGPRSKLDAKKNSWRSFEHMIAN